MGHRGASMPVDSIWNEITKAQGAVLQLRVEIRFFRMRLFAAGMGFAMLGEPVVGPGPMAAASRLNRCRGRGGGGVRAAIPVLRRIGDSPHISMIVEGHANEEVFTIASEGQAGGDARGATSTPGQIGELHRSFQGQRLSSTKSATLGTGYQHRALRGKRMAAIHASDGDGDFHTKPCAAAGRSGCDYFHSR